MFASFYNLLRDHIGNARKRRASDAENERPPKQVKYSCGEVEINAGKMSHIAKDKSDEVKIIGEVKDIEWIAPRKSIRRKSELEGASSSTPIPSPPDSQMWRPLAGRTRRMVEMARSSSSRTPDVQVLDSVTHSVQRSGKIAKKSMAETMLGSFRPHPTRFSQAMKKKHLNSSHNFKKCFEEKMTYKRLLDMHRPSHMSVFTLSDIKARSSARKEVTVIDLEDELRSVRVNRQREAVPSTSSSRSLERQSSEVVILGEQKARSPVQSVNSLDDYLKLHSIVRSDLDVQHIIADHATNMSEKRRLARLEEAKIRVLSPHNEQATSDALEERIRKFMKITEPPILDIDEVPEYSLPELTEEQEIKIQKALKASPASEVLSEKFGITIKRHDMTTLRGLNWLNDEIINFYMNLLMERSKQEKMPQVYAFNTFFYQNMIKGRYSTLKRWTRKVDLFAMDMVFVPVHLGMHWCMSVIDFRSQQIRYYDSMGAHNNACLDGLITYLQEESLDKKKTPFDSTGWEKVNVEEIPQQMNGSDCGVFACIFAEHLARDASLGFSQDDMPYFRRKMVLEILQGALLT